MMRYRTVTEADVEELRRRKLRELELEHAGLALELRLAEIAGLDNAAVANARAHIDVLTVEHAVLIADLGLDAPAMTVEAHDPPAEPGEEETDAPSSQPPRPQQG